MPSSDVVARSRRNRRRIACIVWGCVGTLGAFFFFPPSNGCLSCYSIISMCLFASRCRQSPGTMFSAQLFANRIGDGVKVFDNLMLQMDVMSLVRFSRVRATTVLR